MPEPMTTVLSGFSFLEAPRWHEDRIWFSDFYTYRVYSALEDGSDLREEARRAHQPSGLGWLPDGGCWSCRCATARILRREPDGTLVTHADLSGHATGHLNDMSVDARGRAYVGNFGFDLMSGAALEHGVTAPGGPGRHRHRGGDGPVVSQRQRHHARRHAGGERDVRQPRQRHSTSRRTAS